MEDYRLTQSGQEVQNILDGAAMQVDLTAETQRAESAETTLQGNIDIEERDRKAADLTLQGNIDAEELRAKAAEKQNADDIDALEEKVPSGASSSNKLATEDYVNDKVSTDSATFRGTYNVVSDLSLLPTATHAQIEASLLNTIATADNNDYAFVQIPTSAETPTEIAKIERYKFNGTAWAFEYELNNSGFTSDQWAAINSGITGNDVTKLAALPTNTQLTTLLNGKQDTLTFDSVPTQYSNNPVKSGGVYSAIDDEKGARQNSDAALQQSIEAILLLIPSAATSLNQLADKAFVNSSIATSTATFRGTYNLVSDLHLTLDATRQQIATALAGAIASADNNDYAFVQVPTSEDTPSEIAKTDRYKFNGEAWAFEYELNNSGFTATQWAAINSGITQALVTKLSALPTNADLTTALGVLTDGIAVINAKIPAEATTSNKLVDTTAMQSYIAQVLDTIDATFNITSTDGHVTVQITQADGVITSVAVTTSDIASDADLIILAGRVTTAEGNISTNADDIAALQAAYSGLTQSNIVVGALPSSGQQQNIIYRQPDQDHTPPQFYSDYMWNGTTWVLMATYNNAIDPRPKKDSQNLVTSGGVFDNMGALDVSDLNATENPHTIATYADLSAALAAIPSDYQKGGMSIKFVLSSDNKYAQYRLMINSFSISPLDWQGVDDEILLASDNLIESRALALPNFDLEGKAVYKKVFTSNVDVAHTKTVFSLKSGKSYVFTLQNDSDTASLNLYKLIGDATTYLTSITRGTPATITPNQDWDGFAMFYGTAVTSATLVHLTIESKAVKQEISEIVTKTRLYASDFRYKNCYYNTTGVSVNDFIDLTPLNNNDGSLSEIISVLNGQTINLKNWLRRDAYNNVLLVNGTGKVLAVYDVHTGGDFSLSINSDGYLLLTCAINSNTYVEGVLLAFNTNNNTGKTSLHGKDFRLKGKYYNTSNSTVGTTLDVFHPSSNNDFSADVVRVQAGDRIMYSSWYGGSVVEYAAEVDIEGKVLARHKFNSGSGAFYVENDSYLVFSVNSSGDGRNVEISGFRSFPNEAQMDLFSIANKVNNLENSENYKWLIPYFFSKMKSGDAVKIGFFGDSTTEGVGTTGWASDTGHENGEDWDDYPHKGTAGYGTSDYINVHAYPYLLENLLKAETGNNNLRVYNMGWSGKNTGWANSFKANIFGDVYSDVDIVGIAFGINDSQIGEDYEEVLQNYVDNIKDLIEYIYSLGKQVFLVKPQAVLRSQEKMIMLADAMDYIADKYSLQVFDMSDYDRKVLKYSELQGGEMMNDLLHGKDSVHKFEAGYLFSQIVRRTCLCSKESSIAYTDKYNNIESGIENLITYGKIDDIFKAYIQSSAGTDSVLMDVWVLNDSDEPKDIVAICQNVSSQYCVITDVDINSQNVTITNTEQDIKTLNVGDIVHLVVHSGTGAKDFVGFKLINT